eukprot:scaffold159145_cov28-Tisochrysis_lutea.AAC.1
MLLVEQGLRLFASRRCVVRISSEPIHPTPSMCAGDDEDFEESLSNEQHDLSVLPAHVMQSVRLLACVSMHTTVATVHRHGYPEIPRKLRTPSVPALLTRKHVKHRDLVPRAVSHL